MDKRLKDRGAAGMVGMPSRFGVISPFVGRTEEVRRLSLALALAAEGQGRTIFLTGEPGIGKTRLAREALLLANQRHYRVLEGRSFPQGVGLAYAPLVDAFRGVSHNLDDVEPKGPLQGVPDLGHRG